MNIKKLLSASLLAISVGIVSAYEPATIVAGSVLYLQVRIFDPTLEMPPVKRTPDMFPVIGIDNRTLTFDTSCDGNILRLANEDGDIEYSTVIPSNTVTLELPSYLEGEYEIQIIRDNLCFYGYITLQ